MTAPVTGGKRTTEHSGAMGPSSATSAVGCPQCGWKEGYGALVGKANKESLARNRARRLYLLLRADKGAGLPVGCLKQGRRRMSCQTGYLPESRPFRTASRRAMVGCSRDCRLEPSPRLARSWKRRPTLVHRFGLLLSDHEGLHEGTHCERNMALARARRVARLNQSPLLHPPESSPQEPPLLTNPVRPATSLSELSAPSGREIEACRLQDRPVCSGIALPAQVPPTSNFLEQGAITGA